MSQNKTEVTYDPEFPRPYQRMLAEEKTTINTETGEILSRVKTGRVYSRKEWEKKGWRFPRNGQTVSWSCKGK